ncbi:MAG: sulfatase-like hydrolase/transferase [Flavobacteriaceae bacterium]|nr:sulfatase-like hydrolase/transferase [Flavobacteriaceae bacterium]
MVKFQNLKPLIFFHLTVNVIFVLFITGASYFHTPLVGWKDTLVYLLHLMVLQTTIAGIIYLLSLHRRLFRIVFGVSFMLLSCFSFWAYTQDISVTPALFQAILETKPDIAIDLITAPYALFVIVAGAALLFILKYYNRIYPQMGSRILLIPALLCIGLYFIVESKRKGSLKNRLPYNILNAINAYTAKPELILNSEIKYAHTKSDSLKMVFVLGETVRADHLQLNGYERETNPFLIDRKNLISFTNLYTKYSYTGASVPQILTNQNLDSREGAFTSLYSVVSKAGYATTWIGNQTLEKSFDPVVQTNREVLLVDAYKSEFSFAKALDEEMLLPMKKELAEDNRKLVTLHMIGSHWWYENRYTDEFRKYTPVIDSKYVPSQSAEQMINSYDNTLIYLDYFLEAVIRTLEKEPLPTVMVYVSDHGEHLGERGKWLHAQAGEEAKNPAYLIWYSDSFLLKYPDSIQKLQQLEDEEITTDVIFETVLKLLDIDYEI